MALSARVRAMDAHVMTTMPFCLEVVLFALAAWIFLPCVNLAKLARKQQPRTEAGPAFPDRPHGRTM